MPKCCLANAPSIFSLFFRVLRFWRQDSTNFPLRKKKSDLGPQDPCWALMRPDVTRRLHWQNGPFRSSFGWNGNIMARNCGRCWWLSPLILIAATRQMHLDQLRSSDILEAVTTERSWWRQLTFSPSFSLCPFHDGMTGWSQRKPSIHLYSGWAPQKQIQV